MRRLIVRAFALALFFSGSLLFGQQVNLSQLNPSNIDLSKVDLSNVTAYFQGPAQFYVTGIRYGDRSYAAILDYDGKGNFTVKVPQTVTTAGKPVSIDLSNVNFQLTSKGIQIHGLGIDGVTYTGTLVFSPGNRDFQIANYTAEGTSQSASAQMAQTLRAQNSELQKKVNALQSRLSEAQASSPTPPYRTAASRLGTTVVSGFGSGSGSLGSWTVSGSTVSQDDSSQLYAKYVIPANQNAGELLYSFTGSGAASGWSGFGLHFLASGSNTSRGYGYGSSYLVWITHDKANTQSDATYVQLYKSTSDVHMVQVANKQIGADISSPVKVSAYVNRDSQTITVLVNGNLVFSYTDPQLLTSGSSVALRSLGKAHFSDLTVQAP